MRMRSCVLVCLCVRMCVHASVHVVYVRARALTVFTRLSVVAQHVAVEAGTGVRAGRVVALVSAARSLLVTFVDICTSTAAVLYTGTGCMAVY